MTLPFNIPPFLVECYAIPIEDMEKLSRPIFAHFGEPFGTDHEN